MAKLKKKTCGGWGRFWIKAGIPNTIKPCFGCVDCNESKYKNKPISKRKLKSLKELGADSKKRKFKLGDSPENKTRASFADILKNSMTIDETAKMLEKNYSQVYQLVNSYSPTIYSIKLQGQLLIPKFQFDNCDLVPHFSKILNKIDHNLCPVSFYNWFVKFPCIDLETSDGPISPRDWLIKGNSPVPVLHIAEDL
mgnify:CR=1 FL=1